MNASTHDPAAFAGDRQCSRHECADRRENDRCIQRLWRLLVRATRPDGTQLPRKLLALEIAWTGEGEHISTLGTCNLREKMSGCSKAVQAQIGCRPCGSIRPVADEPGT